MAEALRSVLTEDELRSRLAAGTRRAAARLGTWDRCVARFAAALEAVSET
jgi:hypothetical protein